MIDHLWELLLLFTYLGLLGAVVYNHPISAVMIVPLVVVVGFGPRILGRGRSIHG